MATRDPHPFPRWPAASHPADQHPRRQRSRWRGGVMVVLVVIAVLFGPGGLFTDFAPLAHAAPLFAQATSLTPTTQDRALATQARLWGHQPAASPALVPWIGPGASPTGPTIPRQVVSPQPRVVGTLALTATGASTLSTSDGRLTFDIPVGAITANDLTRAGGALTLQITQLSGSVGGGASGHISLGVYRLEVLGTHGRVTGLTFHHPLGLHWHFTASEAGVFRQDAVMVSIEGDTTLKTAPTVAAKTTGPVKELVHLTPQASAHALQGQVALAPLAGSGAATLSFNTSSPQATWPTVQDFQTDLNTGALTYGYPIGLPPGPGGFQPTLQLSYSSASVNENHNVQTSASWVGEGWSLDMGAITWSQINENSGCLQQGGNQTPPCSLTNWQNVWNISASGIGGQLLPKNVNYATGPNAASDPLTGTPQRWYTAPDSHANIEEINCTTTDLQNNAWTHPCWRVWLPSGELLEFGATKDSVEYYVDVLGNKYIDRWNLDGMIDTHGNQIQVSYYQFTATDPLSGLPFVRDAVLSAVAYDSPTCQNTTTFCTPSGTAPNNWNPLVQVLFDFNNSTGLYNFTTKPTRLTAADSTCQNWTNTTIRCDNPTDYSGGLPAPQVLSVGVLNDIQVKVRPTTAFGPQLLRAYVFSYEQHSAISGVDDAISGQAENVAGYLDLTKIQQFGSDWTQSTNTGTSWPAETFAYNGQGRTTLNCLSTSFPTCTDGATLQERYLDPAYQSAQVASGAFQCIVWYTASTCNKSVFAETLSQRYLVEVDNGLGWQETFTWQEGHMNVNGVPSGRSVTNPFGCASSDLNASPCWQADSQHWSRILLVGRDAKVQRTTSGGTTITVDHHWGYAYTMATVASQNAWCASGTCPVVWDWGNVNDGDYADYYNGEFRGFSQVQATEQEIDTGGGSCTTACTLSVTNHAYITTQGWGVWDQTEVTSHNVVASGCWNKVGASFLCPSSPYWATTNAPAGRETQTDEYASDGTTLLKRTLSTYSVNCGPTWDPTTAAPSWDTDGKWWTILPGTTRVLVSELDQDNPVVLCDPQLANQQTLLVDGGSIANAPSSTTQYTYDQYGNVTLTDTTATDGGSVGGSGNGLVQATTYVVNTAITTTATSATGTYIVDTPSQQTLYQGSTSGAIKGQTQHYYDGNASLTAPPSRGDLTQESVASSGAGPFNYLTTKYGYDGYGNLVGILKPNGQTGCTVAGVSYSSCATYDTAAYPSNYAAHVVQVTNALGQTAHFDYDAGVGAAEWLKTTGDLNGNTTTYQYDALGRVTGITQPGETVGLLTTQYVYTIWCPATGPSLPCTELDTTQRYDSSTTVTSRTFYDGWGKPVETRTPADGSNDVVTYTTYDARENALFTSRPYSVSAYTGAPGSAAYSAPDGTQLGTSAAFDALGRQIQSSDPAGNTTTTTYFQTGCCPTYEGVTVVDANHHMSLTFVDALGRKDYLDLYTGNSNPYTVYSVTGYTYDFQGNLATIAHPDGTHTTTYTYDLAGRKTGQSDPDLGNMSVVLDADGNVTQQTDGRGQSFYIGYDALDRPLWRNTTNVPTGAYVTYSYDGTVPTGVNCTGVSPTNGNKLGHITTEQFTSGPGNIFSGVYCYDYSQRGQKTGEVDTLAGTTYKPFLWTYNDAGVVTQIKYAMDGEYEQFNFSAQERLTGITRTAHGTTNSLVPSITYNGAAGAAGLPDSYVIGGTGTCASATSSIICASLSYDTDFRLAHATFTHPGATTITYYDMVRGYDAVGNVTSVSSALPAAGGQSGGQDNQQFCYDALNRLTWAGTTGTNPCTGQAVTGTTLTSASYTASYQYDTSMRLTQSTLTGALASSSQGAYSYDGTHYHAVVSIGSSAYTAWFDAAGNMTCRAPTNAQVCNGTTQTGASLTYDVEGRLIQWVSPGGTTTVKYGYDGEGNRFEMQVDSGGSTTTTTYMGALQENQTVSGTTTKIAYFYLGNLRMAMDKGGTWSYFISDGLSSTTIAVDNNANVTAAQLFGPYGQVRWSGGSMPTSYAFTSQRADSATGLDFYGARYYDPAAGRFISADTVQDGLDRYGYVGNNPETATDPTGHNGCYGQYCSITSNPPSSSVTSIKKGPTKTLGICPQCVSGYKSIVKGEVDNDDDSAVKVHPAPPSADPCGPKGYSCPGTSYTGEGHSMLVESGAYKATAILGVGLQGILDIQYYLGLLINYLEFSWGEFESIFGTVAGGVIGGFESLTLDEAVLSTGAIGGVATLLLGVAITAALGAKQSSDDARKISVIHTLTGVQSLLQQLYSYEAKQIALGNTAEANRVVQFREVDSWHTEPVWVCGGGFGGVCGPSGVDTQTVFDGATFELNTWLPGSSG